MPVIDEIMPLPQKNEAVTEFLKNRRSNLAKLMGGPGPSDEQLSEFWRLQLACLITESLRRGAL